MSVWALGCLFLIGAAIGPVVNLSWVERGEMVGSSGDCDPADPDDPGGGSGGEGSDSMPTEVFG